MSKYNPLTEFLMNQPEKERDITVSFDTLEKILGDILPRSAYSHRAWWGNEKNKNRSQAKAWLEAGWMVDSVNISKLRVRFIRMAGSPVSIKKTPIPTDKSITKTENRSIAQLSIKKKSEVGPEMKIVLVSCVKSKTNKPMPARELYTSPLFKKSSAYAEQIADRWFILSAKYGLLEPDRVIAPYEKTLNKMPVSERRSWASKVSEDLLIHLKPGDKIIFLAGIKYREFLIKPLEKAGCQISIPMEGLAFGQQLSWLKKQLDS